MVGVVDVGAVRAGRRRRVGGRGVAVRPACGRVVVTVAILGKLLSGYERACQFGTDLGVLAATVTDIVLFRPPRASLPPDGAALFPLRCGRCGADIRLATGENPNARRTGAAVYRDRHGGYACDGRINHPHEPKVRKDRR